MREEGSKGETERGTQEGIFAGKGGPLRFGSGHALVQAKLCFEGVPARERFLEPFALANKVPMQVERERE